MQDAQKAIQYLSLAAERKCPQAQNNLGIVYLEGKYVKQDIKKAIHYFTLAAYNNEPNAQYVLGDMYIKGTFIEQNINKGMDLLVLSSKNRNIKATFIVAFLYHDGKLVQRNMNKSIEFYKDASTLNNVEAKNNLGVIYKNGFKDEKIPKNICLAIEYFNEAIKLGNDILSIYNLAHIYVYEDRSKIDDSIDLLLKIINMPPQRNHFFYCILTLLNLALIIKHDHNIGNIRKDLVDRNEKKNKIELIICTIQKIFKSNLFETFYKGLMSIDILYDLDKSIKISNNNFKKKVAANVINGKNITKDFYLGFDI